MSEQQQPEESTFVRVDRGIVVGPGDTLVITVNSDRPVSHEDMQRLRDGLREALPDGTRYVVIDGVNVAVIKSDAKPCPECQQGKHPNCTGETWSDVTDGLVACPCATLGHEEPT